MELTQQFAELDPPTDATSDLRFSAAPVEGHTNHRIAMDRQGLPALLISVADGGATGPPLVLEHLRMQQGVDCRITEPTGTTEVRRFTIIRCTDDDADTLEYFLRIGGPLLEALGEDPSGERVSGTIERLVELFRALSSPPRKSVIGFWGELFLIASSEDVTTLAKAWHAFPEERFDFALNMERLEVKSALGRLRRHHFSLEQVTPIRGVDVLIASLLLERSGSGPSMSELIEGIKANLTNDASAVLHVDTVVALTLGSGWRRAMEARFDADLAAASLMFFQAEVIPRPEGPIPPAITEVSFLADLRACPGVSLEDYTQGSGLFAGAVARS